MGFGLMCGEDWTFGSFTEEWNDVHITVRELYPLWVFVGVWGEELRNKRILFWCDNESVVAIINRQSSKNSPQCMVILRKIVLACLSLNCVVKARHIKGSDNGPADALSRNEINRFRYLCPKAKRFPRGIPMKCSPKMTLR